MTTLVTIKNIVSACYLSLNTLASYISNVLCFAKLLKNLNNEKVIPNYISLLLPEQDRH
jgi:hypothetical protein